MKKIFFKALFLFCVTVFIVQGNIFADSLPKIVILGTGGTMVVLQKIKSSYNGDVIRA